MAGGGGGADVTPWAREARSTPTRWHRTRGEKRENCSFYHSHKGQMASALARPRAEAAVGGGSGRYATACEPTDLGAREAGLSPGFVTQKPYDLGQVT